MSIKKTVFHGYIDYLDDYFVRGWAVANLNNEPASVRVALTIDGEIKSVAEASNYRIDLDKPACLLGKVGFEFRNPVGSAVEFLKRCDVHVLDESRVLKFKLQRFSRSKISANKQTVRIPLTNESAKKFGHLFIVGAPRSGTSALHQVLTKCTGWMSFNEGHLLSLAHQIEETVDKYRKQAHIIDTMAIHVAPDSYWQSSLVAYFREMYTQLYGTRDWIDKTPGPQMIAHVQFALKCWPDARFIFMKRRGIENIRSGLSKFSHLSFEALCDDWALCLERWSEIRGKINGSFIEIDQYDMLTLPGEVGKSVASFLGLSDAQRQQFVELIQTYFPERTSGNKNSTACALDDTGWASHHKDYFRRRCGPMMRAYGYSMNHGYYQQPEK
ncbi:MAG: sulfotransferase [Steroidobacteraceae bacterium]